MRTFENIPAFEVGLDTDHVEIETKEYYIDFDVELETEEETFFPGTNEQPEEGGHEVIVNVSIPGISVFDKEGDPVDLRGIEVIKLIEKLQNQMIIL